MHRMTRGKPTHADRLERYLGADKVAAVSAAMQNFYWPVPMSGVPGRVFAMPGGDFAGEIQAGQFASKFDRAADVLRRVRNRLERQGVYESAAATMMRLAKAVTTAPRSVGAFASVDAVVAAATGGKAQTLMYGKTGVTAKAAFNSNDLWFAVGQPAQGAVGAAAPGGTAATSATTGSMGFLNVGTANTGHYLSWQNLASLVGTTLLYDRLFMVAVGNALTTPTNTAVTGLPTRYQNTVSSAGDYIGGNFAYPMVSTTILANTAHNWAVGAGTNVGMRYLNQANTEVNMPVQTAVAAQVVGGIDLAAGAGSWFAKLATGDVGVKGIRNMLSSAAVATGTADWVVAHPLAINACMVANIATLDDGLFTSLNLQAIFDNACLAMLEMSKPATTATTYSGYVRTVSE